MRKLSFAARNYRCFTDGPQGLPRLQTINLVIGRNNSGKSALVDIVGWAINDSQQTFSEYAQAQSGAEIVVRKTLELTSNTLARVFPENRSGGVLSEYHSHWEFGRKLIGECMTVEIGLRVSRTDSGGHRPPCPVCSAHGRHASQHSNRP